MQIPGIGSVDLFLQFRLAGQQRIKVGILVAHRHGDGFEFVQQRLGGANAFHNIPKHVLGGIQLRLLRQVANTDAISGPGFAVKLGVDAGHDLHQGRFTGTIAAKNADLGARQETQPDILQNLAATGIDLGQALHHINVLIRGHCVLQTNFTGCQGFSPGRGVGKAPMHLLGRQRKAHPDRWAGYLTAWRGLGLPDVDPVILGFVNEEDPDHKANRRNHDRIPQPVIDIAFGGDHGKNDGR